MKKRYVTMLAHKIKLGEELYMFSPYKAVYGFLDEKTSTFTDLDGNLYYSLKDDRVIEDDCDSVILNSCADLTNIEDELTAEELDKIIKATEEENSDYFYIASLKEKEWIFVSMTRDDIDDFVESYTNPGVMAEEEEVDEIISNIVANQYSCEELKNLKDEFEVSRNMMESVIDSIKLKMEAEGISTFSDNEAMDCDEFNDIDIDQVYNNVVKTLIAQDAPALRMISEIARIDFMHNHNLSEKQKYSILLTGSSGVGKTLLMSLISKYINRPFKIIDSTQLTTPGYTGKSIEEYLWELYVECDKDINKAERAIIFFDEIDKKGSESRSDPGGRKVIESLLKFLDGTTYKACENMQFKNPGTYINIDTSKMIVIVGGAFLNVYDKNNYKNGIGFNSSGMKETKASIDDFVNKGLMTYEFMRRNPVVIHMNDLDEAKIKDILLNSDRSPIKIVKEVFDICGINVSVTENYLNEMAKIAFENKNTGVGGLLGPVQDSTWEAFLEVNRNRDMYSELILDKKEKEDKTSYTLVKKINK